MTSKGEHVLPGWWGIRCQARELSKAARMRLAWFRFYETHDRNARLTCRRFGITPQTFYRWRRRYEPERLESLESRSSRPQRVRQKTWSAALVQAVLRLRRDYPRWSKYKLAVLLEREGIRSSSGTVGRILRDLKQRGKLIETKPARASRRSSRRPRPYAVRKPWGLVAKEPGDLVEVDTKDIRPLPGILLKHFTARDIVSRWDVLDVHHRATSCAATLFLNELLERMPFPVRALQVDGGSEFKALFEKECARRGLPLYVLPPKSPKLNAHVERGQRCHGEEFYEVYEVPWTVTPLRKHLRWWETVYNTVRPHQALGYLTPQQFLERWKAKHKEDVSPRS